MTAVILVALVTILAVAGWLLVLASIGYADYLSEKRRDLMNLKDATKRRRDGLASTIGDHNS